MSTIAHDPVQWIYENCRTKAEVKYQLQRIKDLYEFWEDEEVKPQENLKKYCVHFGVRLTADYYVRANSTEEAIEKAQEAWSTTEYQDMEYADDDVDAWEDESIRDDELDIE